MSLNIVEVKGKIRLETGLHIGAGNDDIHIGGIDNSVVKDKDGFPYIPGSSLKGKIRSLLELYYGLCLGGNPSKYDINKEDNSIDNTIPIMFGDTSDFGGVTRLLFRDCFLSNDTRTKLLDKNVLATESKSENTINRLRGKAEHPRNTERAIAGLEFDYEIIVRVLDDDDEKKFKEILSRGMKLLEQDALGGSGSRGYGKIKFIDSTWNGEEFEIKK